ncbi:MAG: hypothetical protein K8R23_13410 [Chthoniobacter sp.]|nr:hypothetical protein [Chthoniobacter sp.]
MFARDFVVDSWNETRDAGIWMFLEDGSEGTSDEGIMDNWSKIRLLSERSLHIQIDAIKAIHASGKRIEDAIRIFTKLHSLLGADLLTVMSSASGILVKAPAKLTKRTIAPVLEELLAHTRKYKLFSDITAEQAVQITLSGGVFFL